MGAIAQENLEIGKTYQITHNRKGSFGGRCLQIDAAWGKFQVVSGQLHFRSEFSANKGKGGDTVTLRLEFCKFEPFVE